MHPKFLKLPDRVPKVVINGTMNVTLKLE